MSPKRTQWGRAIAVMSLAAVLAACSDNKDVSLNDNDADADSGPAPIGQRLAENYGIPYHAVIAHRGVSYYAPEETRPAYKLARDVGADYLELDLQRTSDGHLIALHDTNLKRTTNIEQVFPDRADNPVSSFTLAEIKQLDAGSWFNAAYPERARPGFAGLKILTLDEVRQIAENGENQPGLYLETKAPELFPGIEKDLADYLLSKGWIGAHPRMAPDDFDAEHHVNVGYTRGRVILQTFSKDSLVKLNQQMPDTPKILLLFLGGEGEIPADDSITQRPGESDVAFQARQRVASREAYDAFLDFARAHGAVGVGPSATRADLDPTYSYADLAMPWMIRHAHRRGLLVHVYTLDDVVDFRRYQERGVDGIFTNDAPTLLRFEGRPPSTSAPDLLDQYGY
ncbi:glycerophosphodiester phosphodiesterase [Salinisphaera sp.]|uniref:glycerophosphodiester phosphodiesterase n=1 Tax=Salinisphaera sp. TaxID=1914330 RepID=UPI002D796C0C|nr:glycerophosphodiester phosphodiesterase [Salinisphaera sp.]HET7315423.1 glycerophosphodiester phosphodiesterase [Salinisphaera sp.]